MAKNDTTDPVLYEIVTDKLGPNDGWGEKGSVYSAADYPDIEWERLASIGAVKRPGDLAASAAADFSNAVPGEVIAAQPHREFVEIPEGAGIVYGASATPVDPAQA